jgi:glycosyltransferase involved in cell wall biosynthesis
MQNPVESAKPLVSVVIAAYNMGIYVCEAVRSVLAQTYSSLEVIVIDDGSKDDTWERLREFEGNPQVHCVKTENQGQPKAKNEGLKRCTGQFIAFCDADDLYEPYKIERQLPEFELDSQIGVVYTNVSFIDPEGRNLDQEGAYPKKHRIDGWITEELILRNFIPFGTAMFRRECVEQLGMFDEHIPMGIDWDLWLRYSLRYKFRCLPVSTYKYRVWPGQMSKNFRGRYTNAELIMTKFLAANPGVVSKRLERRAWSDTYANKAVALALHEKAFRESFRTALRSVVCDCLYAHAWWALAKSCQLAASTGLRRASK